jgi:hypothetical protein
MMSPTHEGDSDVEADNQGPRPQGAPVLTAMAVLLGVSFISAMHVLTDTVKDASDSVFAQTLTGVDLRVQSAPARAG